MLILLDLIFDLLIEGWFSLMQRIIPEKMKSRTAQIILKIAVGIFSGILFVVMFIGIIGMIVGDADTRAVVKYMVYIPLAISTVQIIAGITLRFVKRRK